MNISSESLEGIIEFFETALHPEQALTKLVLEETDDKNVLKLGIGYEVFLAKTHGNAAIRMLEEYQALYEYEEIVGT